MQAWTKMSVKIATLLMTTNQFFATYNIVYANTQNVTDKTGHKQLTESIYTIAEITLRYVAIVQELHC